MDRGLWIVDRGSGPCTQNSSLIKLLPSSTQRHWVVSSTVRFARFWSHRCTVVSSFISSFVSSFIASSISVLAPLGIGQSSQLALLGELLLEDMSFGGNTLTGEDQGLFRGDGAISADT